MNSEEFLESFEVSQHHFSEGWKSEISMDRIWRWRHRSLPEKFNNFPRYANSVGTWCQSPFPNISSQFWENRLTNSWVKKKLTLTVMVFSVFFYFFWRFLQKSNDEKFQDEGKHDTEYTKRSRIDYVILMRPNFPKRKKLFKFKIF